MKKDYQIDVKLKELLGDELFGETYKLPLAVEFVTNTNPKQHSFKNHVLGFVEKLKQNSTPIQKQSYTKRQIYTVNFGMNTGSEVNGTRPALIYKNSHSTFGDDVVVIPLTSIAAQKAADKYDIIVPKDDTNKLYQSSHARLRQIRSVSVKRLGKSIGLLNNEEVMKQINEGIAKMLDIVVK